MDAVHPQLILHDLVKTHGQTHEFLQFATYISAYQYLKLYRLLKKYSQPGARILDWGTGSGHFSYFLVQVGYRTSGFGFDAYPQLCRGLEDRYHYHQGSPEDPVRLPFADAAFDAVTSVGVLEHVRETGGSELGSLKEICRILKPGGVFISYHFPNKYSWIEYLARTSNRFSHAYLFTGTDIHNLVAATPFQCLEMGRYALLPRNIWQGETWRSDRWGPLAATLYNQIDTWLGYLVPCICQNYYFVLRKLDD